MNTLIHELCANGPVVTDGAWGTQLQVRGLPIGECPDAWNLEHPDRVESVARAYVDAGSQVILTNTFGASRIALARHGFADRAAEINRLGVEISRRAAGDRAKVFASIGPTGKMLAMDEVSPGEVWSAFAEQAHAITAAGADAIVVETMSDLDEATLAVRTAVRTGLPVVACMVFDSGRDGDRTIMGQKPEEVVGALEEAGASVIGSNCGRGAEQMLPICRRLRAATRLPIWIKPNAGLPVLVEGKAVYTATPDEFVGHMRALIDAGADFVGGCCGTSPDFIRALAESVRTVTAA